MPNGTIRCIDDEIPFDIPQGWVWCRFRSICKQLTDGTHNTPHYTEEGVPFLSVKDMSSGKITFSNTHYISIEEHEILSARCNPEKGDLLLSKVGTTGIPALVVDNRPFSIFVSLSLIKFFNNEINTDYLIHLINSPLVQDQAKANTRGVGNKNWVLSAIADTLIVIPPKNQQNSIVEFLNGIKQKINSYAELFETFERLNVNIKNKLSQSILQEAIQGRLVPQIASEGTADELLEKIRAEKLRLVKEGKLKKSAIVNEGRIFRGDDNKYYENKNGNIVCIDEIIPFDIPPTWQWSRIGSILNIWSARRVHEKDWRSKGIPFYRAREIGKLSDTGIVNNDLFIDRILYDEFSKNGVPQIGDLMITAVGTLGKTYIIKSDSPFYFKDGSVLCIGNSYHLNPAYLRLFFDSNAFKNQYISESDGTTVATLTMVRMNKYVIPIPPLKEQARIVTKYNILTSIMSR